MEQRYIKIKGYENWFLCITAEDEKNQDLLSDMNTAFTKKLIKQATAPVTTEAIMSGRGMEQLTSNLTALYALKIPTTVDYYAHAQKYDTTVLVRESGTWMTLGDESKVTDEVYSDYWPEDSWYAAQVADIDCELGAEENWYNNVIS